MTTPVVRPARPEDAAPIGDIYNHYILHSHATYQTEPHDAAWWGNWLAQFSDAGPHRAFVLTQNGIVDGYVVSARFNERQAYGETVITSVYLRDGCGGKGLGGLLYEALFEALENEPVHRVMAWIALPNEASVALHHRFGYRDIGTMTEVGFKFGQYWDVLMLEKNLG